MSGKEGKQLSSTKEPTQLSITDFTSLKITSPIIEIHERAKQLWLTVSKHERAQQTNTPHNLQKQPKRKPPQVSKKKSSQRNYILRTL